MKVYDLHGDLFYHFTDLQKKGEKDIFEKYHLSKFTEGNVELSLFNIWIDDSNNTKEKFIDNLIYGSKEIYNNKNLNKVVRYSDIDSKKVNYIIGLEGVDYLSSADDLYFLYEFGVRLIGLTWNYNNKFAHAQSKNPEKGLTEEGKRVIEVMNELGMIIDVSHLSDRSLADILEISTAPIIASHSNCRTLCETKRNLTDEQIIAIAKTGGIIGMNSYPAFIDRNVERQTLDRLVDHVDYIVKLVGVDYVALGFDFMDYLIDTSATDVLSGIPHLNELKNHSDIGNLINKLSDRGYTKEDIELITHKNAQRVFRAILK